ncbi:ADP-ribosylation factor GTPase-activating protein 2 isoform X1 [Planococcus citri]|uniref:ADP-ribosylation factor GTPase-activating protein 2 isoform X1 n=1 Tax=Planococcus citri TaxID=170843 RepID=UPI0031F9CEA3
MALEGPSKTDIQLVFKRLRAIPTNKVCFDCNAKNPTWASVTYGVFICLDCSAVHRSLGVHLSFVRSTQLDTNWTWLQLRQMQLGGNASASSFFRQHNCTSNDAQQKYNSRAAQLYKDKLSQSATQALKTYGTQLMIDNVNQGNIEDSSEKEEPDFFEEHSNSDNINSKIDQSPALSAKKINLNESISNAPTIAPSVENAFSSNINTEKSHIIGVRSTTAKRSTLGGKKGGLGAQKVKTNFADIERDAALADQIKFSEKQESVKVEDTDNQVQSVRLAYQDLSIQQKKEEDKLKQIDPKKAEQVERLGMGFNTKSGVSHSAFNDMKTLEVDEPVKKDVYSMLDRSDEDDFFERFTSIPEIGSLLAESKSKKKSSYEKASYDAYDTDILSIDRSNNDYSSKVVWEEPKSYSIPKTTSTAQAQKSAKSSTSISSNSSGEAQKKFGAAKSISSAQYFGDNNNSGDDRMNLCQFEGSTSISSADLFGRPSMENSGIQAPDFDDVKESVRLGVTKVAGKLSSLANGVMSSIQERYGNY